jgi:hypothetical protein
LNRDPIGEKGGLNVYRHVSNNAINNLDINGLAPSGLDPKKITYVQAKGWTAHGWIRPGTGYLELSYKYQTPYKHCKNGKLYQAKEVVIRIPKSWGYHPTENVREGNMFREVGGMWTSDHIDELNVAAYQDASVLKEWTTKIRKGKKFELGPENVRGKSCDCATFDDFQECLILSAAGSDSGKYRFPFNQCRTNAKEQLKSCCLELDKRKKPAEIGEIIEWKSDLLVSLTCDGAPNTPDSPKVNSPASSQ